MGGPDRDHQDAQKIGHHNRGIGKTQAVKERPEKGREGEKEQTEREIQRERGSGIEMPHDIDSSGFV